MSPSHRPDRCASRGMLRADWFRSAGARRNAPRFPAVLCAMVLCWLPLAGTSQGIEQAPPLLDDSLPCVDVTVNDHPVLSYDCLNRQLTMTTATSAGHSIDIDAVIHEPGNRQVGQFNFSSLSHRMGANLGHSVLPQRPPMPQSPGALYMPSGTH